MSKRGRKRTPTNVLKLKGTFRADRHGDRGEDTAGGRPKMPQWMRDPEAKAHWRRVIPTIEPLGIAKAIDAPALGAMCVWWATWRQLQREAMSTGEPQVIYAASNAWKMYDSIAQRFGLTPSDRSALKLSEPTADDPFTQYMKNRRLT